ncbi:helix-turn-helix domain-containing protein [Mycolicibacter minnesotensis]
MEISASQARLIRDVVAEVMLNRQRHGQPIPDRLRDLVLYVSACGHETSSTGTSLSQENDDMIDTEQAAKILDVSIRHIRRLASDLDGRKPNGRWLFHRNTVTEYSDARATI